ncbi:MAG: heme-binding protein [Gammaproteobacteria bacterium]
MNLLPRWLLKIAVALTALPLSAAEPAVHATHTLTPAVALELAQASQAACRARDFQVTVVVVERGGLPQVALRDRLAGNFTWDIALAKARTAAGFRQPTRNLVQAVPGRPELDSLHQVADVILLGGGVPVEHEGQVIAAVGVSGAPTPQDDHECAEAGIEAIAERLLF